MVVYHQVHKVVQRVDQEDLVVEEQVVMEAMVEQDLTTLVVVEVVLEELLELEIIMVVMVDLVLWLLEDQVIELLQLHLVVIQFQLTLAEIR